MPIIALLAVVLALGTTAFTPKAFVPKAKPGTFSQIYVYIGDASPEEQRDPLLYVKPSVAHPLPEECGGTTMICTVLRPTDEGENPDFSPESNPYDTPGDFTIERKPDL